MLRLAITSIVAFALTASHLNAEGLTNHGVVSGDTLFNLSLKYKVSVEELQRLNKLTNSLIRVGQVLRVPDVKDAQLSGAHDVEKSTGLKSPAKSERISTPFESLGVRIESLRPSSSAEILAANRRIESSVATREDWTHSESSIVLGLVGAQARRVLLECTADSVEAGRQSVVKLLLDGLDDDAISGEWHQITLRRSPGNGVWQVVDWKQAFRSAREGASPNFFGESSRLP